ncbi:MAG: dockerin type I domain-containing protein [Candidatus Poribacteria bacterium]|nr:dockerin type I domain-containing protein [Candidatus Poribacteria bacterium]
METTSRKPIIMLLAAMLFVVAVPSVSNAQALQSDEFDGSGQNLKSFWEVQNTFWHVQEGNEGSYTLSNGNLVVEGAFYQNLWDGDWTRRFYQVTDQEKFSVETSLVFDHKDVCAVAGLAIKSPAQNEWVTLKLWGQSAEGAFHYQPNTAVLQFQQRERHFLDAFGYNPAGGNIPIALRLDRDGDTYTAWYKPEAQGEWVFTGETTVALQGPLEVGIFTGICQDEAPGSLTVTFNNFRVTTDATELARRVQVGPKIEGPWLWTIVPTSDKDGVRSGIDFLAEASNGRVTETAIATEGARAGDIVGFKRWTSGKIAPTGWNNMNDLVNAIGLGTGDVDNHVAYGVIALESPSEQVTTMFVGTDDTVKVWLNGTLVHSNPIGGGAAGYQESFPITLRPGKNILLVAVYESWGGWSGFFGFEKGTTYTVLPPADSVVTRPTIGPSPSHSQIYVDAVNGVNAVSGRGSADKPYKTITFALLISERTNLPDPWQVHIRPGIYEADPLKPQLEREVFPIKLRNNMILSGTADPTKCIIDAKQVADSTVPILNGLNVGGVTIQNLTIQNMNRTESAGGIDLWDHTNTVTKPNNILSCVIHNNTQHGIITNMPLVLANNTISNNRRNGVWSNTSVSATHNTFSGNVVMGVEDYRIDEGALHIDGDSSSDIFGNTFQNIESDKEHVYIKGVFVTGTLTGKVSNNIFTGAGHGIYIREFRGDFTNNICSNRRGGMIVVDNFTGNFSHNNLSGINRWYGAEGLTVGRLGQNRWKFNGNITHNTFTDNSGGFAIYGIVNGNIAYNKFIGNSRGTYDSGSSFEGAGGFTIVSLSGSIKHNLFIDNSFFGRGVHTPGVGGFMIKENATDTIEVSNNVFINNIGQKDKWTDTIGNVGDAVITRQATHFFNNLFLTASDKLVTDTSDTSAVVSEGGTVWVNSPGCRFHNNIFSGGHTAIFIEGNHDLPITHNLFHNNILNTFVNQAGNAYGTELEIWELFAANAHDNIVAKTVLIDLEDQNYRLENPDIVIDAGTNEFAPADDYSGNARPVGETVDIGPYEYPQEAESVTVAEAPAWDVNEDGQVNILDLVLIARFFGQSDFRANPRVDVNGDGVINILDLVVVASHFGEFTGVSAPAGVFMSENIDVDAVQSWIALAQVADDGSAVFREGIANLKRLQAVSTPQKTALLANYPNPFNPETWIPYQLAKPADVTLHIYAADGKLVRTLAFGYQGAGKYHHRSRAAHWDGKNEMGESVASGVYFYTLTAGDFTATRKMLILK